MSKPAPPPRLDPSEWWDHQVFREAFLAEVLRDEQVATIRGFGKLFNSMAHEVVRRGAGTFAEATARRLQAVLADLRQMEGYLGSSAFTIEEHEESYTTPRDRRWRELGVRLSEQLARLADQVEEELRAGLALSDH